ncbi:RND family efflux transporter, MFP subunit [Belliella baltica DSM 15883]|uniref:RND family efflux transporter, MFP subunit n=1 Tax=Belliella baltica (strain DSM 15883 / CIP 108006 / LMG 21964 / BA134) TaxID=866536 RepID=I3Z8T7_BELBD|nr:efflux RND transporter periplasmic adaptor subunit [Belliella baltica]AFL85655.1 RND family efflux transporter, MFP subunit [Belliella baltica DSM 15883]
MKSYSKFLILPLAALMFSCAKEDELSVKKAELDELKTQASELRVSIETLEKEISALDPEFGKLNRKSVLISTTTPKKEVFQHFVEVTGAVLSKKNVNISGEVSGRIQEITAVEGMRVSKGDILAVIDAESIQRNIEELEKQLELAVIVFEKQERLWKQQIGTEIQYLETKNRKESLEKSMAGLKTQLSRTKVRAPFNGTVETVNVRLGELVQPGTPMFQFVGESDLFIESDVSERYVGIVNRGDSVVVSFPSINKTLKTKVSAIGAIINPNNRTFKVEVVLPNLEYVKPNMISVMKIKDYENKNAITVPNYLILQDSKGDYIFVVENGLSKKKYITRGKVYQEITEVLEGLDGSEILVDKGFREIGDNFSVNIAQ